MLLRKQRLDDVVAKSTNWHHFAVLSPDGRTHPGDFKPPNGQILVVIVAVQALAREYLSRNCSQ